MSPALARLVTPPAPGAAAVLRRSRSNVAIGLRSLQTQTALPTLEKTFTLLAGTDPGAARELLDGLGRYFQDRKGQLQFQALSPFTSAFCCWPPTTGCAKLISSFEDF